MPRTIIDREPYEPWREALKALDDCLKDTKDRHQRAILLADIAAIDLLIHIKQSLDRVPVQYGENR